MTDKCKPIYLPWVFIVVMTTALYSLESALISIRTLNVPVGECVTWTGYTLTSPTPSGLRHYHTWASQNICPYSQFKHTLFSGRLLLPHPELLRPGMRVPIISSSTVLGKTAGMFLNIWNYHSTQQLPWATSASVFIPTKSSGTPEKCSTYSG